MAQRYIEQLKSKGGTLDEFYEFYVEMTDSDISANEFAQKWLAWAVKKYDKKELNEKKKRQTAQRNKERRETLSEKYHDMYMREGDIVKVEAGSGTKWRYVTKVGKGYFVGVHVDYNENRRNPMPPLADIKESTYVTSHMSNKVRKLYIPDTDEVRDLSDVIKNLD